MHRPQFELGKTTIGQLVDTVAEQFADCKSLEYPNRGVSYNYVVYALCPELYTAIPGNLESTRLPKLKNVVFLGEERHPGMFTWDEIIALGKRVSNVELALELFRHTIAILAKFKIPRIIEFVSQVPKTISGKIRRIELRENEITRKEKGSPAQTNEFFCWDFPELRSTSKK